MIFKTSASFLLDFLSCYYHINFKDLITKYSIPNKSRHTQSCPLTKVMLHGTIFNENIVITCRNCC